MFSGGIPGVSGDEVAWWFPNDSIIQGVPGLVNINIKRTGIHGPVEIVDDYPFS